MKWLGYIGIVLCLASCKTLENISVDDSTNAQLFVDELAQLYTIAPNNTIIKYDQDAKMRFEYSDNTLGPITNFDVSNPLQILAFHENFQVVKIFDRTLTLNSQIDLNKLDLFEIHVVASSNDNRIWVFDELNQELLKIDKNGKVQGRNNDLRLRLKENATPYKMIEYQNMVYLFDKTHGLLIFNNFGEFVTQRAFDHHIQFSYLQGHLFFRLEADLNIYKLEDGSTERLILDEKVKNGRTHFFLMDKIIYLVNNTITITAK